jgi:DtxR family Mn-dependent transcriptional regulator
MSELVAAHPDPWTALAVFGLLAVVVAVLGWPRVGVLARYRAMRRATARVRLEDGLKHLYTCESGGHPATVDSVAGALGLSRGSAVELVRQLERLDLVHHRGGDLVLTRPGREYALRMVRTHRLWERYLADRTGTSPLEWHREAERLEHGLSGEQVEGLAARMGHPLYDPHGDPIPTAAGVLPPARGVPLTRVSAGSLVRVVHIEDEPEEVFQSLHRSGIGLDTRVRVLDAGPRSVALQVEGRPVTLELLTARNLTVEPVADGDDEGDTERLDILRPGEEAEVVRLSGVVQGSQRRRLLDLGIVPGTVVRAELASASGDPVAYRIRGAVIALRKRQAREILIRRRRVEAA